MKVRLIRKPALVLNGIDVSRLRVGDVVDLQEKSAKNLIAEGWAEPVSNATPAITRAISPQPAS